MCSRTGSLWYGLRSQQFRNYDAIDSVLALDAARVSECIIDYRKSRARSRAAYVLAGLIFAPKINSLDKPRSYLSHPRLQAMACK